MLEACHIRPSVFLALGCLTVLGCPPPDAHLRIHDIQGSGHRSPYEDQAVRGVSGVVTVVAGEGHDPGFWIEDADGDGDDTTSEGLFVATEDAAVTVGQAVEVDGLVREVVGTNRDGTDRDGDLTTTRIEASDVRVTGDGALPSPVRLGPGGRRPPAVIDDDALKEFQPASDAIDFYESLEGMRVEVHGAVVVGPTLRRGELVLLADGGDGAMPRSHRGGVLIRPGDDNPERLLVAAQVPVDVGDRFDGALAGVLDYGFANFRIRPTGPIPPVLRTESVDETTPLPPTENQVTVATFNVHNFSANDPPEKLQRLATSLVRELAAPDLVALQEVQDENGPDNGTEDGIVTGAATFEALAAAVEAAGGPRYDYRQIDPVDDADGGQPGGNIRVGFLFNPARVGFVDRGDAGPLDAAVVESGPDGVQLSLSPGRVASGDPAFERSRKPLAGEFSFRGHKLFVIVNHLSSKGGDDPLMGRRQPPQRSTEEKRSSQAKVLHDFMESFLELDPAAKVVVLGDLNEMEFRPPIEVLKGDRWVNLIDRVPLEERYTFIFQGNSQVLDHILVSPALADQAAPEIDIVHVNVDFAEARRGSDHDPVLVRLTLD